MATTHYTSKTPVHGKGITCEKVEITKYQEQASAFSTECTAYSINVQDADTYIDMINSNLDKSSADPLMQTIVSTVKTIETSNSSIESSLSSLSSQVSGKAKKLDEEETYYKITKVTEDE